MTKPAVPRELLDPVVEYFKPQRVILFGEDIARLALKRAAHLLQSVESNPERLAFLQTPKRGVTNACLFGQPVERPLLLFQQLIDSDFDHYNIRSPSAWFGLYPFSVRAIYHNAQYVSTEYIAFLTYIVS